MRHGAKSRMYCGGIEPVERSMKKTSVTTPVKGGWVKREAHTGQFVEVRTSQGASKANSKTQSVLKEASSKRKSALSRLADR